MSALRHPPGPLCSATLRLELRERGGPPLLVREAHNVVARSGAELLAALFTSSLTNGIDAVAVGISEEPNGPPYEISGLTRARPGGEPQISKTVVPIDPGAFELETLDQELRVRVSLRTLIPADMAVHPDPDIETVEIAEAALGTAGEDGESLAALYNRVVFEPFRKARKHEVSLYWEISFPYGPNA